MSKTVSLTLFCPFCKLTDTVTTHMTDNTLQYSTEEMSPFSLLPSSMRGTVWYTCNECGRVATLLDGEIADSIIELNSLGYNTAFCCAGHTPYENSYIAFSSIQNESDGYPPISYEKRKRIADAYNDIIERFEKYKPLRNKITLTYQTFDHATEKFVDVSLEDDNATLDISYIFARGLDENANFDLHDYEEEKELFWQFIRVLIFKIT